MGGDNDLAAIRARVVAATPGPWYVGEPLDRAPTVRGNRRGASCLYVCETRTAYDSLTVGLVEQKSSEADAELIAHAPTDLLALCAEVERLRAEVAALRAARDALAQRVGEVEGSWGPDDVLAVLVDAANLLLHRFDYDGDGHEQIAAARDKAIAALAGRKGEG